MAAGRALQRLLPFKPPAWAAKLPVPAPPFRCRLAMAPTPIEPWSLPGMPRASVLAIKRDDLTGNLMGGNKVRKLEFLMADALAQRADTVITCGAVGSNHARATAAAAAELGLECHLLLRSRTPNEVPTRDGNLLLDSLLHAHIHLIPRVPFETGVRPRMAALGAQLARERQRTVYHIPVGGSNHVGLWGYLAGFEELLQQGLARDFDELVVATGSGGTLAGLAIGNFLAGRPVKITAIAVCDNAAYFHGHVNEMLECVGLGAKTRSEDILTVLDDFRGRGYGLSTDAELDFIQDVAASTGILLDPVYTGKAAFGLSQILKPTARTLFLHTGGTLSVFGSALAHRHCATTSRVAPLELTVPIDQ